MRSGISLLAGVAFVLGASIAAAQQAKPTGTDPDPWHIAKVAKLNVARPGGDAAAEAGPQKYLHIEVNFTATPDAQKKHKFRVVNAKGEEAGELWGWNDSRSLVIFEGQWGSLEGLYLDGIGHREPLFATAKPPAGQVAQLPATQPGKTLPKVVENAPRTTYVPATDDRVVVGGDRVIVKDNPDRVVVREGDADRVVVEERGGDRIVVHHHGDGTTKHVDVNDGPKVTHVYDNDKGEGNGSGGKGGGKGAGDGKGADKGGEACEDGKGGDQGDETGKDGQDGKDAGTSPAGDSDKGKCPLGDKCPCGKDCPCGSNCPCGSKAQAKDDGQGDESPAKDGKADGKAPGKGQGEGAGSGSGKGDAPCDDGKGSGSGQGSGKSPGQGMGSGSGKGDGSGDGGDCPPGTGGKGSGSQGMGGKGSGGSGMGPGGMGSGGMGRGGEMGPGMGSPGMGSVASAAGIKDFAKPTVPPAFVFYISTGEETSDGKVYQVDENGRVLGWVNLPYTATGMALHRTNGLVVAIPRDGGKIMRIDDTGKLATIIEKDKTLVHPVDVAIAGDSDTIVVADNISDVLAATSTEGVVPKVYQRFEGQKWTAQDMSVAVTNDKHVILGTDGDAGIYRYAGDAHSAAAKPLLPANGGVAADSKSLRWAAAQAPNLIYVFEGEELFKKLRLPPGKSFYRNGLLSFSPADSLCVAVRNSNEAEGEVWILMYNIEKDEIRSLFPWNKERMTDFVVGPRMLWDRRSPNTFKSIY